MDDTNPQNNRRAPLPIRDLRRRLNQLRWLVPLGLLALVILYEALPARWLHETYGYPGHLLGAVAVYGTVGPVLAYLLLSFLGRWLEERETSELQAQVLAQAREHARITHDLTDDVLQSLFGLSVMLGSLRDSLPELTTEQAAQLDGAEAAVNRAIQQLYTNTTHIRTGRT